MEMKVDEEECMETFDHEGLRMDEVYGLEREGEYWY